MAVQTGDVIEAVAGMEFNQAEDVMNVFQFQYLGIPALDEADVLDDIVEILETVYTTVVAILAVITVFKDIRATNITQSVILGTTNWPTLVDGSAVGDTTPPGVAGLVNFATDVPRVAPRKYIGVMTESNVAATGLFAVAATNALSAFGAALLGVLSPTTGTYRYGYLSPKTGVFESVVSAVVTNVPAYQRRRKQGRGS